MSERLQQLLTLGLVDIDDSDERFKHLDQAAAGIAAFLQQNPAHVPIYALVAVDENVPETDPALDHAERVLTEHWRLLRRRYPERPKTLLRFLLLDALERCAKSEPRVASAAGLALASWLDHVALGREGDAVREIVREWIATCERVAVSDWKTELSIPEFPKVAAHDAGPIAAPTFAAQQFRPHIEKAPGPTNNNGQAIPGANPHWPNNHQVWAHEFSNRMADAFATAANTVAESISATLSGAAAAHTQSLSESLVTPLSSFVTEVGRAIERNQRAALLRLDLLWWKQALYSPSAQKSYRSFPPAFAVSLMARDLLDVISVPSPRSVAAFLRETVAELCGDSAREVHALHEWVSQATDKRHADLIARPTPRTGRILLSDLFAGAARETPTTEELRRTGLSPELAINLPDLAAWIFAQHQAETIANGAKT